MENKKNKSAKARFYRKRVKIFNVINKIKLWPSRSGRLHGVRSIEVVGEMGKITTHCNKEFLVRDSRNSRAGRWLRNKWYFKACPDCRIPDWKIEKYGSTRFRRHQGSLLMDSAPESEEKD